MLEPVVQRDKVSLLLVDDDDLDVMGVERALKKLNLTNPLIRVKNGQEGLDVLRQGEKISPPFIILLDINMPVMNGIEMLRELREDLALKRAVVFMFTTSADEEDKINAYNWNVAGYILKQNMTDGFKGVVAMLDRYCDYIELPLK